MSLTVEQLVDKAIDQRRRGRQVEALLSAIAATELEADNPDAWWQVSLNRWALGDAKLAVTALERTVRFAPYHAPAWARLGSAYLENGDKPDALGAFETALGLDADNAEALRGAIQVLEDFEKSDPSQANPELLLSFFTRLDNISELSASDLNKVGILHYNNKSYYDAINFWERSKAYGGGPATLFNLGLAYNQPDVARTVDAIDMWRLTLKGFPDYKSARESLSRAMPAALACARAARVFQDQHLLPEDQWYVNYLNPLELLNCPSDIDLNDLDARVIKRFKDKLLKEIELEDGMIAWIPGARFDKSKALAACEELSDEKKREYHWYVFRNKSLLDFLSRGDFEHFLVNEVNSPIETIDLLNKRAEFREWLSGSFAKQFDLVLSKAIDLKNPTLIKGLLAGRRWVAPAFTDACFQATLRQMDRLLQPLRDANARAEETKPSVAAVKALLDENSLLYLLNSLPIFNYEDEAALIIRSIAHAAFANHSDIDLAKAILQVSNQLRKTSAIVRGYVEEDFKKIDQIIQKERESEARLTSGDTKWEITKHGARLGSKKISAGEVVALRWGVLVNRQSNGTSSYDFLLAVKDRYTEISYSWRAFRDIEKNEKTFNQLLDAALIHLFPHLIERIDGLLKAGWPVRIGPCSVTERGISFKTTGWFSSSQNTVPWDSLGISIANGDLTIFDKVSPKIKTTMAIITTDNAMVVPFLVQSRT